MQFEHLHLWEETGREGKSSFPLQVYCLTRGYEEYLRTNA